MFATRQHTSVRSNHRADFVDLRRKWPLLLLGKVSFLAPSRAHSPLEIGHAVEAFLKRLQLPLGVTRTDDFAGQVNFGLERVRERLILRASTLELLFALYELVLARLELGERRLTGLASASGFRSERAAGAVLRIDVNEFAHFLLRVQVEAV